MFSYRTDLALEAGELYKEQSGNITEIDGVISKVFDGKSYTLTTVNITNENGEKALGKKRGTYLTFEMPALLKPDTDAIEELTKSLTEELTKIIGTEKNKTYLVCGLGNRNITPDSIGPLVASKILVTRHLKSDSHDEMWSGFSSVSAISPGVLGITGIETVEIIKGVCEKIHPDIVIVIDALAARKPGRICTSIQITDTGISPGSGVKNHRKAIDKSELGVPVIVIGVPMVIDLGTIALDVLNETTDRDKKEILYKVLSENNMIVTPKDIDVLTKKIASVISLGINCTLHKNLSKEEIDILTEEY